MTKQQAKRIFFNWLKKRNTYEQYKHNRHINNKRRRTTLYRSSISSPSLYILDAFLWDNTIQGYDFWSSLNDQWMKYFNTLNRDPRYN